MHNPKSPKECLMGTFCGNASGNHKMKHAATGKAKKPQLLKGSKAN
jgi:hypothetical protein